MAHIKRGREAKLRRQEDAQTRQEEYSQRTNVEQLAKLENEGHRFCKEAELLRKQIKA